MATKAQMQEEIDQLKAELSEAVDAKVQHRSRSRQLAEQLRIEEQHSADLERDLNHFRQKQETDQARLDGTMTGMEIGKLMGAGLTQAEAIAVHTMRSTGKATPPRPAGETMYLHDTYAR